MAKKQDIEAAVEVAEELDEKGKKKKKKDKKSKNVDEFGNELPKKKRRLLKILLIVIPVFLCAGFVFGVVQWNLFGVRDVVIETVNRLDPEFAETRRNYITLRAVELEEAIDAFWIEAEDYRDEMEAEFREIEERHELTRLELEDWEAELVEREQRLVPIYRRDPDGEEFLEMQNLGNIYSAMSAAAAAERLIELHDRRDAAAILLFMSETAAAAILSEMEPRIAAELTDILLYN